MKKTRVDQLTDRAKDHPVVSVLIVFCLIIVGLGAFTDAVDRVISFGAKYLKPTEQISEPVESRNVNSRFVLEFSADDWDLVEGDGSQLRTLFSEHGVEDPVVSVQQRDENGNWQEIGCEVEVDEFHNVTVRIGTKGFKGRIVLK